MCFVFQREKNCQALNATVMARVKLGWVRLGFFVYRGRVDGDEL